MAHVGSQPIAVRAWWFLAIAGIASGLTTPPLAAQVVTCMSVTPSGAVGGANSGTAKVSGDGTCVAFESYADDLAPAGQGTWDVFVRDRHLGATELVSQSSSGVSGVSWSYGPSPSRDGKRVAFYSNAWNLVNADGNGALDVFLRDRTDGTTRRVSVSSGGSDADGDSLDPAISANGRFVAFVSYATNLDGADLNGMADVFLHDTVTQITQRISVGLFGEDSNGTSFSPSISADGRYVAFGSYASNLATDSNPLADIFVYDRATESNVLITKSAQGLQSAANHFDPDISDDGTRVAFDTTAVWSSQDTNGLPDVYVTDLPTHQFQLVSVGVGGQASTGMSNRPRLSANGHQVAFDSVSGNLVAGGTSSVGDAYLADLDAGTMRLVSISGVHPGNGESLKASVSDDGSVVAFMSLASDLIQSDDNGKADVFVNAPAEPWHDLGHALAGSTGDVMQTGTGSLAPGDLVTLSLSGAKGFSPAWIIVGISAINAPFKGGVMVPDVNLTFALTTDFFGKSTFGGLWPAGIPSGFTTYFQWWILDPAGPKGFAASNALAGTTP